jgi:hypothetical protein
MRASQEAASEMVSAVLLSISAATVSVATPADEPLDTCAKARDGHH